MSASATSNNVQSAVSFLRDPNVQDSPLAKKVAFLEAKGLNQTEIDTALRLAAASSSSSSPSYRQLRAPYPSSSAYAYPGQQDRMRPDWRDWFIMAVVGGGVGAVMVSLARVGPSSLHSLLPISCHSSPNADSKSKPSHRSTSSLHSSRRARQSSQPPRTR